MSQFPALELFARLSDRQKQCLRLTYDRKTSKEIAALLGLGVGTVNTYITEAISVLNARNRRHAAEMLHDFEGAPLSPERVQLQFAGVPNQKLSSESPNDSSGRWWSLLPVRQSKASGNDLSIFLRLSWAFGISILGAIAFGMLAIGVRIVSDILRALLR